MTDIQKEMLSEAQGIETKLEEALHTALQRMTYLAFDHAFLEERNLYYGSQINLAEKHPLYKPDKPVEELKKEIERHIEAQKDFSEMAMDMDVLIKALEDAYDVAKKYKQHFVEDKDE